MTRKADFGKQTGFVELITIMGWLKQVFEAINWRATEHVKN